MKHNFFKLTSPLARSMRVDFVFNSIEIIARINNYHIKNTEAECQELIEELWELTQYQQALNELPWQKQYKKS